jgi:large subunit ribosomal protein L6
MCINIRTKKIKIPKNVTITYQENSLILAAIHGTTLVKINPNLVITNDKDYIFLTVTDKYKKYLGLYNSLIKTHLKGITQKFKINLFLKGIGLKVQKIENDLIFKLGYSHDIRIIIPINIDVSVLNNTNLILYGFNWEQLTQFASNIKKLKKVEPYKGKGILLKNEQILRKEGKKNKK